MTAAIARRGVSLLLCALLAACGTSPISNHYLLTSRLEAVPGGNTPVIGVGPVFIPEYLNRDALVYRKTTNQLQVDSNERWAEPLHDGITRVMALNLAALLDTDNVQSFPFHAQRRPDWGVKLRVLRFDVEDYRARLVTEWLIYRPDSGDAVQRRLSSLERELDAQRTLPDQIPAAYSDLLWQLGEEVAAELRAQVAAETGD